METSNGKICRYCGGSHKFASCPHLTLDHEAEFCDICVARQHKAGRRRFYSTVEYWDTRYLDSSSQPGEGRCEWFLSFPQLEDHLLRVFDTYSIDSALAILELGCGMSLLAEGLQKLRPATPVYAIDFSTSAVEKMAIHSKPTRVEYLVMDAQNLAWNKAVMGVVVEKGLFDAVICSEDGESVVATILAEIERVLSQRGCLISVSHSDRQHLYSKLNPNLSIETIVKIRNGNTQYYLHALRISGVS